MNKALVYIKNLKSNIELADHFGTPLVEQYVEIPPYTKDEKGKFLTQGNVKFEKVGEVNIQEKINSYRDETNIYSILKNIVSGNVDPAVLEKRKGVYADLSGLPEDFHSLYKEKDSVESSLSKLTDEQKKELIGFLYPEKKKEEEVQNINESEDNKDD